MISEERFQRIEDLIKNVGFPIVVCVGCMWFIIDTQDKIRVDYKEREDRLYKQIEGYQESMDNFNSTLRNIDKRLEKLEYGK